MFFGAMSKSVRFSTNIITPRRFKNLWLTQFLHVGLKTFILHEFVKQYPKF